MNSGKSNCPPIGLVLALSHSQSKEKHVFLILFEKSRRLKFMFQLWAFFPFALFFLSSLPLYGEGPLWWEPYPYRVSSLSWPILQSLQSLRHRLIIIADIFIGCSVGVAELCSRISDPSNQKANLIRLHSLSLGATFDAVAFPNERWVSEMRAEIFHKFHAKKSWCLSSFSNCVPLKRKYYKVNALHSS